MKKLQLVLLAVPFALLVSASPAAAQRYQVGPFSVGKQIERETPKSNGSPAISGTPIQGDTLTTSNGGWSGTVTTYKYAWKMCGPGGRCYAIPGAISPSYTLQADDIGYTIKSKVTACNGSSCTSAKSDPTSVVTTPGATVNPSGAPVPPPTVKDSFGTVWHEEGYDNFTVNAPMGSWGTSKISTIVYTGDGGLSWQEAPDGWGCDGPEGNFPNCYEPSQVLSVHDGELDFYLHDCTYADGFYGACGAKPRPIMPSTGTPDQTYGRYSVRFKVVYNDASKLDQYHMAWMLWPENDADQPCAESDDPELDLNSPYVFAYDHYGCHGAFYWFRVSTSLTGWHTITQEWGPGFRRYYFDGKPPTNESRGTSSGQATTDVYSGPEHWQLQVEGHTIPGDTTSGHILVDWVWIGTLG